MVGRWRLPAWGAVGVALLSAVLAGCDASSPYRATLRAQTRALEEVAAILETVTDKASMRAARSQVAARFDAFESVKEQAQKLPPPSPEVMQALAAEGQQSLEVLQKVQAQVRRIQGLPDGPEFLGAFEQMKGFLGDKAP